MIPFRNVFEYFAVYWKYIGGRIYVVFFLSLLAALTDGLGISLLLPVVTLLDVGEPGANPAAAGASGGSGDPSALEGILYSILDVFGIESSIPGILVFIAIVFLLKGLIKFAEAGYVSHLQAQLMKEIRGKLFRAYSTMDYLYYSRYNTGHFVNLMTEQIHAFVLSFGKYKQFLATLITVLAYFGFALLMNWLFASLAIVAGVGVLFVFRTLSNYVRDVSRKMVKEYGSLNHLVVQTMQAFKYLMSTARIDSLSAPVLSSIRRVSTYKWKQGVASAFTDAVREPLSVAILVGLIVVQITVLDQPLAPILVAVLLIFRATGQIVGVQSSWQATMNQIGSLEIVEDEFERLSRHQRIGGERTLPALREGIELNDVSFAYDLEDGDVLQNITLRIDANEAVAFVGESGAGKSTLVDLLTLMIRPRSGELLIDGVSHEDVELESWRGQIGFVSQETVVFDDTVAKNISLWRGDYDSDPEIRQRIREAAENACALEFIEELPEGFNTRVGDRGIRLSGGQRQRLFIARELYKNPRLLILDEATSALDTESESLIKESVDGLKGSTTVVMIAHRLSTIRNADRVYVLERGRIVEEGSYDMLTNIEGGVFNRMVSLQTL